MKNSVKIKKVIPICGTLLLPATDILTSPKRKFDPSSACKYIFTIKSNFQDYTIIAAEYILRYESTVTTNCWVIMVCSP
jgi:hypothetical protein